MKKPGEKGKCLSCKHCNLGKEEINAWCMYKNMRYIHGIKLSNEDRILRHAQLKVKYEGQLVKIFQNKSNPNWCPLRQEEF